MNRNRQRTLFVLFCIAVGVAAVVSLRTLGLMIADALTGNLQAENRGDIVVSAPDALASLTGTSEVDPDLIDGGNLFAPSSFSAEGLERIAAWGEQNGYQISPAVRNQLSGRVRPAHSTGNLAEEANLYAVQPGVYPYYGALTFVDPAGSTLAEVLVAANDLVISERLAGRLGLEMGDEVQVSGPDVFVVAGIVEESSETTLTNANSFLFPYALLAYETAVENFAVQADTIYVRLPMGADVVSVAADFETEFSGLPLRTTEDLRQTNSRVSDAVTKFVTVMGLVSLLIGGIGIINTMTVVVSQRTLEIAVLKTVGLPGHQITFMFLIEALVLGVLGSIMGVLFGVGLVFVLQQVAEQVLAQALDFAIYPQALWMGLVTGILITLVFGFLPTIAAGQVRPSAVLHPDETIIPRAGRLTSLVVVLVMTVILGGLVGLILENIVLGIAVAFAAMLALAVALFAFWFLAFIFSRLPSLGSIYLKLAQRAVGANAGRTASTLLALVVGMFSLSLILLMTQSVVRLVEDALATVIGGNVLVGTESLAAGEAAEAVLADTPAVLGYESNVVYTGQIVAINGERNLEPLIAEATSAGVVELFGSEDVQLDPASAGLLSMFGDLDPRSIATLQISLFLEGLAMQRASDTSESYAVDRGTTLADSAATDPAGMVLQEGPATRWLGLDVGDTLTIQFGETAENTLSIVGVIAEEVDPGNITVNTGTPVNAIIADGALPAGVDPQPPSYIVDVQPEAIDATINALSAIDGVFALDISTVTEFLNRLFNQIAALPLIVAVLALIASSVIIANTVSLATLERRREIGIMKALGLPAGKVLNLLLLENGLVGLLGGVIGTGIGAVIIFFSGILTESLASFPFLTLGLLILLAIAIALIATLITAYGASRQKPLHVLRYE
jgi:ABC-type antimicrobial peptide transport system permease subunit